MSETLPPDLKEFVQQAVANGEFASEDDVVNAGVCALRELKARHDELSRDIQLAIEELDRREGSWIWMRLRQRLPVSTSREKTLSEVAHPSLAPGPC